MKCRHCGTQLEAPFVDLGYSPPSNAYLAEDELSKPETYYPLRLYVCEHCFLVQTEDYASAKELFTPDYAYFSSTSMAWLEHAKSYANMIRDRLHLDHNSFVIEVASNDGYLLTNFIKMNIPCLGIEPARDAANAAVELGVPVLKEFFSGAVAEQLRIEKRQADLIVGNNVYAHVPDINDFTRGLKSALKPDGTITLEFPHLLQLLNHTLFDTIYHEHYSYLSLGVVKVIFSKFGLRIYDVDRISTHGGSLRVYGCHEDDSRATESAVDQLISIETKSGLFLNNTYSTFQKRTDEIKNSFLTFLLAQRQAGKTVIAYGAAAKGNTLINYAGVKPDLISAVCDAAPSKYGKYMPGSHIPILPPEIIAELKPDWIIILPWNIKEEIRDKLQTINDWGGQLVVAIPEIYIL